MNIKFKKVIIENFLSIGEAEIQLDTPGFTLISGVNNNLNDVAKSNGSGKSACLESVIWCLTGETIRGTKDVVNKFTTNGTKVELTFKLDNHNYKIIRYRDYKNIGTNLKLYVDDEDKSGKGIRDTEKILEQYLPDLNVSLLGSVIILGQGLPERFTNNTPVGRKEVLEKLSKSDFMIQDIKDKLSLRKTNLYNELRSVEDNILSDTSKLDIYKTQLEKFQLELIKYNEKPDFDNLLLELQTELITQTTKADSIFYTKLDYQQKVDKLDKEWSEKVNEQNLEYQKFCTPLNDKKLEYNNAELNLKNNITNIQKEIISLKNIKDICPTCGQKLPDVHKIDTTALENNLKIFQQQYETLKIDIDNFENNRKILDKEFTDKWKNITSNINTNRLEQREKLENIIEDYNWTTSKKLDIQNKIQNTTKEKELYNNNKTKLLTDIADTKALIDQFDKKILYNNIEKDIKNQHLNVVNKMITIATREFRGYLLSEIINYINIKSKEYAQLVFGTDNIEFKLDGNNILITYCDKEILNLSGGEKQKVDIIIQFAIRDMLTHYLDFSSNILCLDEIFDNLDTIGCDKIINLISTKLNDIESIYMITHHGNSLAIPYDNEILIEKDNNGISRIV